MRSFVFLIFWVFLAITALSFAGAVHAAGDSLAVFRHWWAGALVLSSCLLLIWPRRVVALAGLATGGAALATVAATYLGGDAPGAYSLYQKNLLYRANSPNRIIRDIRATDPDFITLEEISGDNRALYWILAKESGAALKCKFSAVGDVAVLSRFPIVEGSERCMGNRGAAAMQVVTPDGPVWLLAVHLNWPYPHEQTDQVDQLVASMGFIDGPAILAGDFNMVPWSNTVSRLESVTGATRAGGAKGTYELYRPRVTLPIDHILVPSGRGAIETRPLLGSDHLGLVLRFDL